MSVLAEICARKREHVAEKKSEQTINDLKATIQEMAPPRPFIGTLANAEKPAIIAEVKKASPSKGVIREDFDPLKIAEIYEANGAACLSVLTDEPYFQGHDAYLKRIRDLVELPLLRKDFMIEPYQIYESRALGADCILLIMACLSDDQAAELYNLATVLGMDVLVEVHDKEELIRAEKLKPEMVGINNRNLKTLEVDINTSFDLAEKMPENIVKIAESGLGDFETLNRLMQAGFHGFLVGESLMRQDDIGQALRTLRKK